MPNLCLNFDFSPSISKLLKPYDYIIAGGGCAGLSLAYYLSDSTLSNKRVLIIDNDDKQRNDRTWCFWTSEPMGFDDILTRQWPSLAVIDEQGERRELLGGSPYKMIRGIDFYRKVQKKLAALPNFEFHRAFISNMGETESGAYVVADGQRFEASWVFNSCFRPRQVEKQPGRHHLLQHFSGWWIRTEEPAFQPETGVLMDFRTPQYSSTRFFYVLPLSEREALVEYTVFSTRLLHKKSYERALEAYIRATLGVAGYSVLEQERGVIPMTDQAFPQQLSPHIINLGTIGGAVKPTTGYAFLNIQKQVCAIVAQLEQEVSPLPAPLRPSRFSFYDRLLLNILQYFGEEGKPIFSRLFHRNKMGTILRFLDERTSFWEETKIFASLPILPFLRALGRVYVLTPLQYWFSGAGNTSAAKAQGNQSLLSTLQQKPALKSDFAPERGLARLKNEPMP